MYIYIIGSCVWTGRMSDKVRISKTLAKMHFKNSTPVITTIVITFLTFTRVHGLYVREFIYVEDLGEDAFQECNACRSFIKKRILHCCTYLGLTI